MSDSVQPYGLQTARLLYTWDSPGQSTEVGCHALLQGIFPSQGLNLCFLSLTFIERLMLYHESCMGSLSPYAMCFFLKVLKIRINLD